MKDKKGTDKIVNGFVPLLSIMREQLVGHFHSAVEVRKMTLNS